jgi:hypothetical protein
VRVRTSLRNQTVDGNDDDEWGYSEDEDGKYEE